MVAIVLAALTFFAGVQGSAIWPGTHDCSGNNLVIYQTKWCDGVPNCHLESKTLAQCQEICAGMDDCEGFSYWAPTTIDQKSCIPKSASCTDFNAGTCDPGSDHCFYKKTEIVAPMCCTAMTASCMACSAGKSVEEFCEENTGVVGCEPETPESSEVVGFERQANMGSGRGNLIETFRGVVEECADRCRQNDLCAAFTYFTSRGNCKLKSALGDQNAVTGRDTYVKLSQSEPEPQITWERRGGLCYEWSLQRMYYTEVPIGDNIRGIVGSWSECQGHCARNAKCHMFWSNLMNGGPGGHQTRTCQIYVLKDGVSLAAVAADELTEGRRRLPSYRENHQCVWKYGFQWTEASHKAIYKTVGKGLCRNLGIRVFEGRGDNVGEGLELVKNCADACKNQKAPLAYGTWQSRGKAVGFSVNIANERGRCYCQHEKYTQCRQVAGHVYDAYEFVKSEDELPRENYKMVGKGLCRNLGIRVYEGRGDNPGRGVELVKYCAEACKNQKAPLAYGTWQSRGKAVGFSINWANSRGRCYCQHEDYATCSKIATHRYDAYEFTTDRRLLSLASVESD